MIDTKLQTITHDMFTGWLNVYLAGFAPASTLSLCDSEFVRNPTEVIGTGGKFIFTATFLEITKLLHPDKTEFELKYSVKFPKNRSLIVE